ncbi:MAG: PCMD domain-containing protein, partial [Muribaculaceae bacterium]|nr:PCMD domain-containing protein [Muribaculaceae bacterium]
MKKLSTLITMLSIMSAASAQHIEQIKYGDFENWVTRVIPESRIIGGKKKTLYEIAPTKTVEGNIPYKNEGGSPWATSNVLANVMGIVKGSNAVFPDDREGGGKAAKLSCIMESCKAIGIINIDVCVAGSIFLGEFMEPVKSTSDPYSKMEMGIPFTKRPKSLVFDYKL